MTLKWISDIDEEDDEDWWNRDNKKLGGHRFHPYLVTTYPMLIRMLMTLPSLTFIRNHFHGQWLEIEVGSVSFAGWMQFVSSCQCTGWLLTVVWFMQKWQGIVEKLLVLKLSYEVTRIKIVLWRIQIQLKLSYLWGVTIHLKSCWLDFFCFRIIIFAFVKGKGYIEQFSLKVNCLKVKD